MDNKKKQNILIVHNYYQIPGGEDTVVANEMKMLEKHGHKVCLYSRDNMELKQMKIIQKIFLPITTVFNPQTYRDIRKLIREENIEIVHVHNTLNLVSPAVYYAAKSMKVPVIQTIHNFRLLCPGATFYRDSHICEDCVEHGLKCAVKHRCYRGSRIQTLACVVSTIFHRMTGIYGKINYICLTDFNKEKLLKLNQIKSQNVFVKPNFVSDKLNEKININRSDEFVFVGRLDELKGIKLLFNAWRDLEREEKRPPKLIVCGTGPEEKWCKDFIEKYKIKNVILKGHISNDVVKKMIANVKGLILPTQCYEGFPMTIIEAFSVGTPVLCSNLGNVNNLVEDGVTGYKFQFDSVEGIVAGVKKAIHKPLDFEKIYEQFMEKYSGEKNYIILKQIYDSV